MHMKVAIIGAGFAGLSTAKVFQSFGHQVSVFEKQADVGGVWSASRRYPGLTTQNVCDTYALSDYPYPADYPEWPSGEQVQRYLASYASHFKLDASIQLNTEVIDAQLDEQLPGWQVKTRGTENRQEQTHQFDYLVVCNGIFSQPMVPHFDRQDEFLAAGGQICHTSQLTDVNIVSNKHLLVVGYGKSSCDVAQAVCDKAASTRVVVRQLIWKVPKMLMNVLNYKYLLLTRMGEGLFKYITLSGFEKFLHRVGKPMRNSMSSQVQWVVTTQCKLKQLDLLPAQPFETIARSTVSLVTDGFFESVAAKKITVNKKTHITGLSAGSSGRFAELSDGEKVPADMVVCGTGWQQTVPFLSASLMSRITDNDGNFRLYRSMTPVAVPRLAFNGYNSSFFSQLNREIGALWLVDLIHGGLKLPSDQVQNQTITDRLAWMYERTDGKHSKGTNIIPFSLH
ncbi:MAG: NAD(P)/FAD-dependent oxidoreductase, partial [Limnohabitans sp.]|nr:NAD(P)/FAD-dependent oxidoreductase [Limnohabitans sp.]